ncbi:MAG: GxxExxY protein [Syntrophorhabdaceae bacterium]|nr:GxxExxY protein [Syntrophorhabdaceae bacterium]
MKRRSFDYDEEILTQINARIKKGAADSGDEAQDVNDIINRTSGAVIEVNKELGSGFPDKVYENALMLELRKQGLRSRSHVPVKVKYKGVDVGEYFADIVVEDQIVIDIMTVDAVQKPHKVDLINILRATNYKVGLIVNFINQKAEIHRIVV